MPPPGVRGAPTTFRFNTIFNQPFFAITALIHIIAWIITFIAQCMAESKYHTSKSSSGDKPIGTPIGVGWFGIFYQFFLFIWILTCIGRDVEHQYGSQLATLVSVNVVMGILSSNLGIYSKAEVTLMIYGFGWLVLSLINVSWLIYFTCPEDSGLLAFVNPIYQRKQLIRSSINLRRPGPYDDTPNVQNIILGYSPADQSRSDGSRLAPGGDIYSELNDNKLNMIDRPYANDDDSSHQSHQPYLPPSRAPRERASFTPPAQPQYRPTPAYHQDQQNLQPYHQTTPHSSLQQQISQPQPSSYPSHHSQNPHSLRPEQSRSSLSHNPTQGQMHDKSHSPLRVVNSIEIPTTSSNMRSSAPTSQSPTPISPIPPPTSTFVPLTTPRIGSALFSEQLSFEEMNSVDLTTQTGVSRTSQPSSISSTQIIPFAARALYSYTASPADPRELSFEKGEVVEICDSNGKWWRAKKQDGSSGILPSNYVTPIQS